MKIFREALLILGIYLIGEVISKGFSLPLPGNILGMLILLLLLMTKVIKVEKIESVSNFFLDHLAFFFIPAGVGLISSFDFSIMYCDHSNSDSSNRNYSAVSY